MLCAVVISVIMRYLGRLLYIEQNSNAWELSTIQVDIKFHAKFRVSCRASLSVKDVTKELTRSVHKNVSRSSQWPKEAWFSVIGMSLLSPGTFTRQEPCYRCVLCGLQFPPCLLGLIIFWYRGDLSCGKSLTKYQTSHSEDSKKTKLNKVRLWYKF